MKATTSDVLRFVRDYAGVIAEQRRVLTRLDADIGDGDHGDNLHRGFTAAVERLPEPGDATPAQVLKTVATALISKVGGAAGPLYGTAFLRASAALDGVEEVDAEQAVAALAAALEGLKARGKAEVGDKTMLDVWGPAVDAAREAQQGGADLPEVLAAAEQAARKGVEDTIPLVARKGRASYLGERSAGHQDPGATSSHLLFAALQCR